LPVRDLIQPRSWTSSRSSSGAAGRDEIPGAGERQQALADQPEFLRGENVTAEIEIVALVIDQVEG
jgi:hypothetical protein